MALRGRDTDPARRPSPPTGQPCCVSPAVPAPARPRWRRGSWPNASRRGEVTDACLVLAPTRGPLTARDPWPPRCPGPTAAPWPARHTPFRLRRLRLTAGRPAGASRYLPADSGPEQDVILRELLMGYAAEPALSPTWPEALGEALATRTFRASCATCSCASSRARSGRRRSATAGPPSRPTGMGGGRPGASRTTTASLPWDHLVLSTRRGCSVRWPPRWRPTPGSAQSVRTTCDSVIVDDAQEPRRGSRPRPLLVRRGRRPVLLGTRTSRPRPSVVPSCHLMTSGWQGPRVDLIAGTDCRRRCMRH